MEGDEDDIKPAPADDLEVQAVLTRPPSTRTVLLSFVLAPVVNLLRRLRLGRVPSVLLSVALALGIVLALGGMIGKFVDRPCAAGSRYQSTVLQKIETARSMTLGKMSSIL